MRKGIIKDKLIRVYYHLMAFFLTTSIIFSYILIQELNIQRQGLMYYSALASELVNDLDEIEGTVSNEIHADTGTDETLIPYVNFESLRVNNPGIVAWIKCGGIGIDYPVVQGTDNEYYLSHTPDGTKNISGSIFLDCNNSPDFSDMNTLIHGHNMKNKEMFGALSNYKKQAFYDKNPVIEIYTPQNDYILELFAGYIVNATNESLPIHFDSDIGFEWYLSGIRRRSVFESDVNVGAGDRLVTLSTCTYEFPNARFAIVGKLSEMNRPTRSR